jgi:hypothetical protein
MSTKPVDVLAVLNGYIGQLSADATNLELAREPARAAVTQAVLDEAIEARAAVAELIEALAAFDGMGRDSVPGTPRNLRRLREAFARCGGAS